jgi:1-acyl-sn-glycerol-3-phosphate acyltransferase
LALYAFHIGFVRPTLMWVAGLRYRRRNRTPQGPCLVVSNHNSHLDAAVLMSLFPLRRLPHVHPVAAADYFGSTWFMRTMAMVLMNGIPIERRHAKGTDPLVPVVDMLTSGETLIFFPEGSRGEAGVVAPFRPGVGKLVRQVPGLLVVPVFLSGPERIWPRGQMVPVPVCIDAIVGKPRTYSPMDDPRVIAEQVQQDVLALAPPPPPVPGPRPSPPRRIAICGLDVETRQRLVRAISERLGRSGHTLGIADPVIEADTQGVREVTAPIPGARGRAWLGLLARIFRTGGRFKGEKFVEMVERAQVDEAMSLGQDVRFLVSDGSALVDLVAWAQADFYSGVFSESEVNRLVQYLSGQRKIPVKFWWKFIRSAPEVWLINNFDLAKPPLPDLLVLASSGPASLMQRLRSRGEPLQRYENEVFLGRLLEGYRQVGELLQKRKKLEFLEFDADVLDSEAIAREVEANCRSGRGQPISSAPGC